MTTTTAQTRTQQNDAQPHPTAARYLTESRELEIEFGSYFRGRWSVASLQMIRRGETGWEPLPTPSNEDLTDVLLLEGGDVVEFPTIDQHYSVPALLRGQLGSKKWMHQLANA